MVCVQTPFTGSILSAHGSVELQVFLGNARACQYKVIIFSENHYKLCFINREWKFTQETHSLENTPACSSCVSVKLRFLVIYGATSHVATIAIGRAV
jgi:hypothetical protein